MSRLRYMHHAVEQYVRRVAPALSFEDARAHLEATDAKPTKLKSRRGQPYWLLPDCVAVVKHDQRLGPICVTIVRIGDVDEFNKAQAMAEVDPWEDGT